MKRPPLGEVARRTEPRSRRRALPENYEKAVGRKGLSVHGPDSLARATARGNPPTAVLGDGVGMGS
jgi:hypothetical protein